MRYSSKNLQPVTAGAQKFATGDGLKIFHPASAVEPLLNAKNPRTKIQIDKRSTDWTHRGRLILDRGRQDRPQIVAANFALGASSLSKSYVIQYVDMVTEGGRKAANLTRTLPGKQAQVLNIRGWGK
uniref:Uncharacterized protein n=1 Tax=Romanomermis culicivorax TaxID=13658 RepID=A0A915KV95_ROMCU